MSSISTRPAQPTTRLLVAALLTFGLLTSLATAQQLPRVEISDNNRFLQTTDGQPFFWLGDTAWWIWRLDPAEVEQYMINRAAKGFTLVQGPVLLTDLTNYADVNNPDPGNPSEPWFAHIDTIITEAEQHGLYIAPVLAWGYDEAILTESIAYDWGFYVGDRYKDRTNIAAFVVAGEFNYPDENVSLWTSLAEGLQAGLGTSEVLLSALPRWFGGYSGQTSSAALHDQPWLHFNMHQSSIYGDCTNDPANFRYIGTHNWLLAENDYPLVPVKPLVDAEPSYEQQPVSADSCDFNPIRWPAFGTRRRAYWSTFAGAFGHTYGANGVFQFHQEDDPMKVWAPLDYWNVAIDYPGAFHAGHLRALIESRPFFSRIPGQDFLIAPIDPDVPTHVHATRDEFGRYAMVYIPGADRDVTVNLDLISGATARAWWYSPVEGTATMIGDQATSGNQTFTTPNEGEDWVLVVDDLAQDYPPPGTSDGPPDTPGDIAPPGGDGVVGPADLAQLLADWGPCSGCAADLNADGTVGPADLAELLANWT